MNTIVPGPPDIQTVDGPNPWANITDTGLRGHRCYFCHPLDYPPMPSFHTLCVGCGQLIFTAPVNDRLNDSLFVCGSCEREMRGDSHGLVQSR